MRCLSQGSLLLPHWLLIITYLTLSYTLFSSIPVLTHSSEDMSTRSKNVKKWRESLVRSHWFSNMHFTSQAPYPVTEWYVWSSDRQDQNKDVINKWRAFLVRSHLKLIYKLTIGPCMKFLLCLVSCSRALDRIKTMCCESMKPQRAFLIDLNWQPVTLQSWELSAGSVLTWMKCHP